MATREPDDSRQEIRDMLDPLLLFRVLKDSLARVPGLKYLFGVGAILSILAIARVWSLDRGWTIIGAIAVIAFTVILLVLARLSTSKAVGFAQPAKVLMWFCVALFVVWASLLTTCVFFKWPVRVQDLPVSPVPPKPDDPVPPKPEDDPSHWYDRAEALRKLGQQPGQPWDDLVILLARVHANASMGQEAEAIGLLNSIDGTARSSVVRDASGGIRYEEVSAFLRLPAIRRYPTVSGGLVTLYRTEFLDRVKQGEMNVERFANAEQAIRLLTDAGRFDEAELAIRRLANHRAVPLLLLYAAEEYFNSNHRDKGWQRVFEAVEFATAHRLEIAPQLFAPDSTPSEEAVERTGREWIDGVKRDAALTLARAGQSEAARGWLEVVGCTQEWHRTVSMAEPVSNLIEEATLVGVDWFNSPTAGIASIRKRQPDYEPSMGAINAAIRRAQWKTARTLADAVATGPNPRLGRRAEYGPQEAQKWRVWRRAQVLQAAALHDPTDAEAMADLGEVANQFRETEVKYGRGYQMDRAANLIATSAFLLGNRSIGESMLGETTDYNSLLVLTFDGMLHGRFKTFSEVNRWLETKDPMTRCVVLYGVAAGLASAGVVSKPGR
jgi:hypothetical protein